MITGNIKGLVVVEPKDKDAEFWKGQKKTVVYELHNKGVHELAEFEIKAKTVINLGENKRANTKKNYIVDLSYPDRIKGGETKQLKVKIDIPFNYSETVNKEGRIIEYPFRIDLHIGSVEHIKEI